MRCTSPRGSPTCMRFSAFLRSLPFILPSFLDDGLPMVPFLIAFHLVCFLLDAPSFSPSIRPAKNDVAGLFLPISPCVHCASPAGSSSSVHGKYEKHSEKEEEEACACGPGEGCREGFVSVVPTALTRAVWEAADALGNYVLLSVVCAPLRLQSGYVSQSINWEHATSPNPSTHERTSTQLACTVSHPVDARHGAATPV
jgi:hypothetical protein